MTGSSLYAVKYLEYRFEGDDEPERKQIAIVMPDREGDDRVPVLGDIRRHLAKELAVAERMLGVRSVRPVKRLTRPEHWQPTDMSPAQWALLSTELQDVFYLAAVDVMLGHVRALDLAGGFLGLAVGVESSSDEARTPH